MEAVQTPPKKTQKRHFNFETIVLRKFSIRIAYGLSKLGITALQVLFFRIFALGGGSLFFFYAEDYSYNLIGLGLIAACYVLDLVDGDLARNYDRVTKVGGFLDGNFDAVILNSIILTFTFKFLLGGEPAWYVASGIGILFGTIFSSKMTEHFQNKFRIDCGQGSDAVEEYLKTGTLDFRSRFFYGLITPKGYPMNWLSNFRDYLLVGILFGIMPYVMAAFAIAINFRWIALFGMLGTYYAGIDSENRSVKLFEIFKQSEK